MEEPVLQVGSRVRVTSHGPFRGLRGVIQRVDELPPAPGQAERFCFYLVLLEGAHIKEPVWFNHEEVEPITSTL